jgi:hypothetical protein
MTVEPAEIEDFHRVLVARLTHDLLGVQQSLLGQCGRRYEDARSSLETLRLRALHILGRRDPTILLVDAQLADMYWCVGKRMKAHEVEDRLRSWNFEPDDEVGRLSWTILELQRRRKEAQPRWEEDVRVLLHLARSQAELCLGPGHPIIALIDAQLADIYALIGLVDQASTLRNRLFAQCA